MQKPSAGARLRYAFDNSMSKGTLSLIGWLAMASGALIAAVALAVWLLGVAPPFEDGRSRGFVQIAWMSLMRTLDSGTMGADQGRWAFLFSMLTVTLGGIFVISTLIGVLTSGIEDRLNQLRRGRSMVIERNHTVILGWSTQVFSIVSELVTANQNQRRPCIVILGDADKVEMENQVAERVGSTGRTRVVCRRGSPIDLADLEIASIHTSRSIIILAPEGDDPDSAVIKTVLAITNNPKRRKEPYHIVAEIHDPKNMEVARLVGGEEAELVLVADLISRITVQTCRQSGLSLVYTELLDFGGDEIYFQLEPKLYGKTFSEALLAYEDSSIMGLRLKNGGPRLNPPMDTRIEEGDMVIAISEDDDTVRPSGLRDHKIDGRAIRDTPDEPPQAERTLIMGWNWRVPTIICELDKYVASGSVVDVVSDFEGAAAEISRRCPDLENQKLSFKSGDPTDRRTIDGLDVPGYDHVIIQCSDQLDPQAADARTLVTLLHLRNLAAQSGQAFSIVSEMLDERNRALAEVTLADDFIVSDKLVSLMLSQVSENKELNAVFADLFDPEGSEIYIKPVERYVTTGRPVNFYTVVEAARRRSEVAIGYKIKEHAGDAAKAYGVLVNPAKSKRVTFGRGDRIIVLAEN